MEGGTTMSESTEQVDVRQTPGLYRAISTSSTVYYVDTTMTVNDWPALLRARGQGSTSAGDHDGRWVRLYGLTSGPRVERGPDDVPPDQIDTEDIREWVLRVGSRHQYDFHIPGGLLDMTDFWWTQRPCTAIERLDSMPPESEWTVPETDDPRYRR
jgi:hypothetical protein